MASTLPSTSTASSTQYMNHALTKEELDTAAEDLASAYGPIKCISCNRLLGDLYATFDQFTKSGMSPRYALSFILLHSFNIHMAIQSEALDKILGPTRRPCCSSQFLTRSDIEHRQLKYEMHGQIDYELQKMRRQTVFYCM